MTSDNFQLQVAELENPQGCVLLQSACPQLHCYLTVHRGDLGSHKRREKTAVSLLNV